MKRLFTLALIATAAVASCTIVEDNGFSNHAADTFTASIGEETRTTFGQKEGDSYKVLWSEGDKIVVATGSGSQNQGTYVTSEGGSTSAVFTSEDSSRKLDVSGGAIAGYPAEDFYITAADSDKEVYFTIPEIQMYHEGSFADGTMPMISDVTYEPTFRFRNAAGVLRLNLSAQQKTLSVSSITVTSSQNICGECGYIPKNDRYFFDSSMLGSNSVTLSCGSGVAISSEAKPFNIVVPHQTYEDLTITVKTSDGKEQVFRMKEGKEITVGRSTISTIPLEIDNAAASKDPTAEISVYDISYDNFSVEVNIRNSTSYFCGITTKKDFDPSFIISSLEYSVSYTTPLYYKGSISKFQEEMADVLLKPGEDYVFWVVPANKSGEYTVNDFARADIRMKSFTSGGNINVSISNLKIDQTSISMNVNAKEAKFIYNVLLPEDALESNITTQEKIDFLLAPSTFSTVFNSSDIFISKYLKPGSKYLLLSIAVDSNGRYGDLYEETFETESIPYNGLTVLIEKDIERLRNSSLVSWNTDGGTADGYRYIFRETSGNLWKSTLEQSVTTAQEKMFMDPGLYYIEKTTENSITLSGLAKGTEYILIVTAVQDSGKGLADPSSKGSIADSWIFTY